MGATASKGYVGRDFTTGSIPKQLIMFMIPFLLASVLNSLYNIVDMIIIGQYVGSTGTVSVSLGGKTMELLTNVSLGFAGGGQVLISQQIGAKKREELNATIGTLFSELFIFSAAMSVLCLCFGRAILTWLNTPEEAMEPALAYMRITSAGLPLIFGYNAVSSVLRGMGDSKSPLVFIAIAAGLNLVLDIVFIMFLDMGAVGAALATVIGQGVSLVCSVAILYRKREEFGFDFKLRSFAIDREKLSIMLRIGLPLGARAIFIQGTQMYVVKYVNAYGLVASAAYSIGTKVTNMLNIVSNSARQAAGAMVGQNVGAGDYDRAKEVAKWTFVLIASASVLLSVVVLVYPRAIFGLFTQDAAVLDYARAFMRITVLLFVLSSFLSPLEGIVTGIGNGRLSFLMGILDGVACRLVFSFFFGITCNMGVVGFFLGNTMGKTGPLIVDSIYYFSGKWKKYKKLV